MGVESEFEKGVVASIPAGAQHNVLNTNDKAMKLFTIYAPPGHAPGTVHRTKADAERAEAREQELAKACGFGRVPNKVDRKTLRIVGLGA